MLKEFMENTPIELNLTIQEFQNKLVQDFIVLTYANCRVDLRNPRVSLTSEEIESVVEFTQYACQKLTANSMLTPGNKTFVINSVMSILFELWRMSETPELFFIKIRQKFTPAQIVAPLAVYVSDWQKYQWVTNFFATHKQVFPKSNRKIRTIGVYYTRIFNGGVERFLSQIIPVYIKLGYRIVLFTDVSRPDLEYPLPPPPPSDMFEHVVFTTPISLIFSRLNEWQMFIQKHDIDLIVSHLRHPMFDPFVQSLFFRLSGVKIVIEVHSSIKHFEFRLPRAISYNVSDAMIVLSNVRRQFLENLGVNAYYIPNPLTISGKNFKGRNPKKVSNTLLWVGRIDYDKNPFAIVPIIREVKEKIPDVKLKILGTADNSNYLNAFRQLIATNGLEQNIELCGYHTDVAPFYKAADLLLFTSPMEGFSLVIAESKFYELPLVLYELADTELLRDGKGYISVPQGDSHAAAQAVIKILTDKNFRCKLSAQARESLQPFINYDIAGAWKKVFEDLENDSLVPSHSFANEQIQKMLLEEIFLLTQQVQNLTAQLENLKKN